MIFDDKVYTYGKWIVQVFMPAIMTFYAALAGLGVAPYGELVIGVMAAVTTLIGSLLQISNSNYQGDGTLKLTTDDDSDDDYILELDSEVADLANKKSIVVTIDSSTSTNA